MDDKNKDKEQDEAKKEEKSNQTNDNSSFITLEEVENLNYIEE